MSGEGAGAERVTVRLTEQQREVVEAVAEELGVSAEQALRTGLVAYLEERS